MPYEFSYNADLADGNIYREEKGDNTGKVVGVYTIRTNDGVDRKVWFCGEHFWKHVNSSGFALEELREFTRRFSIAGEVHGRSDWFPR